MTDLEPNAFQAQLKICVESRPDDYETQIRATALMSQAISLKRIADVLEKNARTYARAGKENDERS